MEIDNQYKYNLIFLTDTMAILKIRGEPKKQYRINYEKHCMSIFK